MAYNNLSLGQRISEEYQLLAEEKWIIEAITKLKNQRNCLQVRQNGRGRSRIPEPKFGSRHSLVPNRKLWIICA